MCTVTLIPLENNNFVLTSNRDEAPDRVSLLPRFYDYQSIQLLYPIDVQSQGTWIGLNEHNRLICLLNGGFENHQREQSYRHSRGRVVKDLLSASNLKNAIANYNLENIEPFTLVIVESENELEFYEFVWDGKEKYFSQLPLEPKIWSSSTLYDAHWRLERQKWFDEYFEDKDMNSESLFEFHQYAGEGNKEFAVIMDRGFVKTTSITQVENTDDDIKMHYFDISKKTHDVKLLSEGNLIHE